MEEKHQTRTVAMEAVVSSFQAPAVQLQTTSLASLQAMVERLQAQLVEQQETTKAQMLAAGVMHSEKMEQWKLHCEGISAERSLLRASLPPVAEVMDQKEKEQRLAHIATVRKDSSPPPLADGAAAGGVEDGADAAGANY